VRAEKKLHPQILQGKSFAVMGKVCKFAFGIKLLKQLKQGMLY
jgi:hypothetical protein